MRTLTPFVVAACLGLAGCGHCHDEALAQENARLRAELAKYTGPPEAPIAPAPVFAQLPNPIAIGQLVSRPWYRMAVLGTKVCSRHRVGDETKQLMLGVDVVIDNLSDAKFEIEGVIEDNDKPLGQARRYVSREEGCEPLVRAVAPGKRERGFFVFDLPREPSKPKLIVEMHEPHGFADDRVVVDFGRTVPAAPLPPAPTDTERSVKAGAVRTTPFYRASVLSMRRCAGSLDEDGNEAIGVELLVESFTAKELDVSVYDAKLRDRDGFTFERSSGLTRDSRCKPEMPSGGIAPRGKARGFFASFAVKPGARGLVLVFPIKAEHAYSHEEVVLALPEAR
ncbi:MAG: hypothetical protein HY898_30070 [Deltaproteobacteria bacterium]|nr:hypothetical protein [Deltaproteobacteria bacterium]